MRKRTVKILTGIAIILVVLGLIYAIAVSVSSAKLRRAYADLKKDGRPMLPGLVIPREVSDANNAALLYECAIQLLKAQPAPENNLLWYLGDLSDTLIKESLDSDKPAELKQLIGQDAVTQALSIFEQGTRRDSCRFNLDYDDGINMQLNHLPQLRNLARIFCAKAYLEAEAGNPNTAWNMVPTHFKSADALRTEPSLISQLVRIQMIRLSCDTIKKLCEIAPPNVQQTSNIQNLLNDLDDIRTLIYSIDAERLLFGEWVFNLPKYKLFNLNLHNNQQDDRGLIFRLLYYGIILKPVFLADHAAYLRYMHEGARFAEQPYSPKEAEVLEKGLQKKRHILTNMLAPALFRVKQIHYEMTSELRITQAGLALLQYKQTEDTFPATLEALKLQNTKDPFSDGLLLYKTKGQGFVLYSVGPDQKDNDGSPRQKNQETDWDIVWSYTGGR